MMKKCVFSLLLILLILCGCSSKKQQWQEQYDLGVRYLSDGNYEEAILAFSAAIQIDPNNADAYVLRGDAYVMAAKEEPENADKYLRKARKDYDKAEELNPDLEEELEEKREELEEVEAQITAAQEDFSEPAARFEIPKDAFIHDGHSYYVYDHALSWEDARTFCEELGGHLVVITSQEENDAIYAYLTSLGCESAYIGLTDCAEEGTWVWVTDEASDYRNWNPGEPNGENPDEDYAMFYYKFSGGTWNDGDFGGSTVNGGCSFLCEWEVAHGDIFAEKDEEAEETQPQIRYSFDTFLAEQTYLNHWDQSGYTPAEYALVDLNGDGVEELIIISGTDTGFFAYQVYYHDLESGEIRLGIMDSANPGYFYSMLYHSEAYKALVVIPMNSGSYGIFLEYQVFDGAGFTYIGTISRVESSYYDDLNGADRDISLEEYEALRSEAAELVYNPLP